MLVTLIMINGASLGWDGAGQQARAKGLNIALSSRHDYRGNKKTRITVLGLKSKICRAVTLIKI